MKAIVILDGCILLCSLICCVSILIIGPKPIIGILYPAALITLIIHFILDFIEENQEDK